MDDSLQCVHSIGNGAKMYKCSLSEGKICPLQYYCDRECIWKISFKQHCPQYCSKEQETKTTK